LRGDGVVVLVPQDGGNPSLISTAELTVNVLDPRSYIPTFLNAPISFFVRDKEPNVSNNNNTTHTHTRLNGSFSGTTRVSRYQKGKTNLDCTEAIDSEWQWHQLGNMQACTSLQTDNHACQHPAIQVFYMPDALPAAQPTAKSSPCS